MIAMPAALLRLLTALAVLWMPFGMAPALAAVPAPMDHHAMAADEDCHGAPASERDADRDQALCAAMCTVLPAAETPPVAEPSTVAMPAAVPFATALSGILLEIATPPPRLG